MAATKNKSGNFLDRIAGDKVVWIIALMLCLISLVCIFSSTSRQVSSDVSRLDIAKDQLLTILGGLAVMFVFYKLNYKFFRRLSKYCFFISVVLLLMLVFRIDTPFVKALTLNQAVRCLSVGGFQIHVYEVVKVAMVMYIAWAVEALKEDNFKLADFIASRIPSLSFLAEKGWKELIYICLPVFIVCGLVMMGSNSSAIIIGTIMVLTLLIGGAPKRDSAAIVLVAVAAFGLLLGMASLAPKGEDGGGKVFMRIRTFVSRVTNPVDYEKMFLESKEKSTEWYDALDQLRQQVGAKMAIKEGGILGKGPGQSTQKYMVPVMSEDFMFSFIVEEYGLWGAFLVIVLYLGLLARGSIIARNCDSIYGQAVVAGCCLLISCQAFFHIAVNADIGPMTGQTLPMISNGTSAFLCFSAAFGLILSVSRLSRDNVEKETAKEGSLIEAAPSTENVNE